MSKTSVRIWGAENAIKRVKIHKNGTLNRNAERAFQSGQCHSLALAIHALVGWPIYGLVGMGNAKDSPGHVVVQNPKTKAYIDINGPGATRRWRKRWGFIEVHPLAPEELYKFETYFQPPNVKAAMPFAKKVLERIGVEI